MTNYYDKKTKITSEVEIDSVGVDNNPPNHHGLLGYENSLQATAEGLAVIIAQTEDEYNCYSSGGLPVVYPCGGTLTPATAELLIGWELVFAFMPAERRMKQGKVLDGHARAIFKLKPLQQDNLVDWLAANNSDLDAFYKLTDTHVERYEWMEEQNRLDNIKPLTGLPIKQAEYPLQDLGAIMGPVTQAIISNVQVSPPLAAQMVLAVASFTAQQFADVKPPYYSAKAKPCSNFFLTIAESGERKSAANAIAMAPIHNWQNHLSKQYEQDHVTFLREDRGYKKLVTKAEGKATNLAEVKQLVDELGNEPEEPLSPTVVLNEPTIEGFLKSSEYSHGGRAIITDEAGAILGGHSMSSEKRQHTLSTLSKLWDGSDIVMSRAGRETPPVRDKRLTIHLIGQSVVIDPLLSDPLAQSQGFLARFLAVQAPPCAGYRKLKTSMSNVDEKSLKDWSDHIFNILTTRTVSLRNGTRNELEPLALEFSADATKVWEAFESQIERAQRPDGKYADIKPFASKAAEHAFRLAGAFTVIEQPEDTTHIAADIMARAVRIIQYYTDEHLRLFEQANLASRLVLAKKLIDWIKAKRSEYFYKNDLKQSAPRPVRKNLDEALETLSDHGHIRSVRDRVIGGKIRKNCYKIMV